jgi:hypothetical protein
MSFRIEAFQNRYLSPGTRRVDAIVSVTADASVRASGDLVVGFIVDKSGSMSGSRIESVVTAVEKGIAMLDERALFFVVVFDGNAYVACPETRATAANKAAAAGLVHQISAQGGTAMSTGLREARRIFERAPNAIRRAIFLTDGKNEGEKLQAVKDELKHCEGMFECDCWGVGTDWQVGEVQMIAQGLLGKASLIPDPSGIEAAFREAITNASGKSLKDVRLRLWTPQGAEIVYVKQVNPTIEELTAKARAVSPQIREYNTGSWAGGEQRDFHVAVQVKEGSVGDEMLAARPSVIYLASQGAGWNEQEDKSPEGRIFASWTGDDSLSSRLDHHVAHYTGQDELADAIRTGLEAREQGNEAAATQLLGKAVRIAHTSRNDAMTHRLQRVVDVVDAAQGTVRLKRDVKKAATMDLELESRTTKRVAKRTEGGS